MTEKLSYDDVAAAGVTDWRMLVNGLHTRFRTGDFATGLALVDAIGAAAEEANHHPDITLTYPSVAISLVSHDVGAVTERDVAMARRISELAAEAGATAEPDAVQQLELALDTPGRAEVQPFWQALLGYDPSTEPPDEIHDPAGTGPNVWFQTSGAEPDRQRWHWDVWVPADQVRARIDAAVSAGGRVVAEYPEHSFWVLEDVEGNRSCVCTREGRD